MNAGVVVGGRLWTWSLCSLVGLGRRRDTSTACTSDIATDTSSMAPTLYAASTPNSVFMHGRLKLRETCTHKNAKTQAGNVFVTCDLDLLNPK